MSRTRSTKFHERSKQCVSIPLDILPQTAFTKNLSFQLSNTTAEAALDSILLMLTCLVDLPNFITHADADFGKNRGSHSRPLIGTQDDVGSLISVLNANAASCVSLQSRSIAIRADTIYSSMRLIGCLRQAKILPTQICGPRSEHRISEQSRNASELKSHRDQARQQSRPSGRAHEHLMTKAQIQTDTFSTHRAPRASHIV
jgi:hypothetical protein